MAITLGKAVEDNGWLGEVRTVHSIGEFDIVEYTVDHVKFPMHDFDIAFIGYIDGKCCGESWTSLDKALIGLICRKHDGANSRLAYYVFDALRMPNECARKALVA